MKYLAKVTEDQSWHKLKHSGYKMNTSATGRRYRTGNMVATPTGRFSGVIYWEEPKSQTGDWGDGLETKNWVHEHEVASIASDPDRTLVERRTKAILDALNALETP